MTSAAADDRSERLVDLVGKLLAQAEGTDNEHEAAAFVERAQQLATAHAVDLERARARQRDRSRRPEDPLEQDRLDVGVRGRRGNRHRVLLYVAVARANDVLVNVAADSTYVLGFGHRADLDVVERLWTSLAVQMTASAQRRLDRGEHRAAGVPAVSWRLSYYDGWVGTVGHRLAQARERTLAADRGDPQDGGRPAGPSAELVLRAKGDRVREFYARSSQARGSWRGAGGRTRVSGRALAQGRADGERADLGQPRLRARPRLDG